MMVDESRDEMIRRLKEEIGKLLDDRLPKKGSKIDEIERITEDLGREIERRIEENVTRQEGRGYVGSLARCKCGNVGVYKKDYAKTWQTLHTQLVIPRAYYHCRSCGKGFAPLDEVLGLDRGSTSLRVRDKIARVSAMAPFGRGANELWALCGVHVSAKTFERVAEMIGKRIDAEVSSLEKHILSGLAEIPAIVPERLYITIDGATVPMVGSWKESKVGAVYETFVDKDGEVQARDVEHVVTMGDSEAIGDRIYALAFRRGVEHAGEVVVLADGGRWIWKQARENFPGAIQILDFYHASEHLGEIARAWYGADGPKANKWLDKRKADFLEGRFERVMRSIRAWHPTDAEHQELKRGNIVYFTRNRKRMHYDQYLARGFHIGSGIAESACKCLVQARLKQAGMRWTKEGAASILQLRRLWLDEPEANFGQYAAMAA
jgi:hypothetical protein